LAYYTLDPVDRTSESIDFWTQRASADAAVVTAAAAAQLVNTFLQTNEVNWNRFYLAGITDIYRERELSFVDLSYI